MDKTIVSGLLYCDFSKEENQKAIKKILCEMKPLQRFLDTDENIPLEMVEKAITVLTTRYKVSIQYITSQRVSDSVVRWQVSLKRDDTHAWLGSYSGMSIYETMLKGALGMYIAIKCDNIPKREDYETEKENLKKRLGEVFGAK